MQKNQLKRRVLAVFENRAWLSPPTVSQLTGLRPIRLCYTYLLRLHRFGLLHRRRGLLILYRISDRGLARLAWLRKGEEAN